MALYKTSVRGAMRLPGLDQARYRVQLRPPGDLPAHVRGIHPPPWTARGSRCPARRWAHSYGADPAGAGLSRTVILGINIGSTPP